MTTMTLQEPATTGAAVTEIKEQPEPIKRVSIICSKGTLDMAYPGLILANGARMNGIEAMASTMMKKQMEELEIPSVREMIEILHDSGAELYACRTAIDMFKLDREDLAPQIDDVLTVMDFYDKSAGSQIIFI